MAITGQILGQYFDQRYDAAYSGFLDPVKKNRILRNGMFVCTDRRSLDSDSQKAFDEIAQQIITNSTLTINNNRISTAPLLILSVSSAGGLYVVTTFFPHNLAQNDVVTFSDIQGTASLLNGQSVAATNITSPTTFEFTLGSASVSSLPSTGKITFSKLLSDYLHLYNVKCKFTQPLYGLSVVSTAGTSPITIRLGQNSKFRDSSLITLSSMTGTAAANGTWYTKQLNSTVYQLFIDADLQIPSTGGNIYNRPQGSVSITYYQDATPLFSDRKIDKLEQPSVEMPRYEFAEKLIKFYPLDRVCSEINIDYIRIPQVFIDVTDTTFDLSLVYPEPYLYFVVDNTIKLLSTPLRDSLLRQEITSDIIDNG